MMLHNHSYKILEIDYFVITMQVQDIMNLDM